MKSLALCVVPVSAALCALLSFPSLAAAQTPEEIASRRALLEEAQTLETNGDRVQALEFAERAGRIQMTASVRLFIARQQLALGRPAQALGTAELCVREATPGTPNREAIVAQCTELSTQARSRVGRIIVRPPGNRIPGLIVRVGGATLNEALLGAPYMVSPGTVTIDAEAPGHANFHEETTVGTGATVTVELRMAQTASRTPPPPPNQPPPSPGPPIGPIVLMAGGGGLVLVGAVFFGLYAATMGELRTNHCSPDTTGRIHCYNDTLAMGVADRAETAGTVGWTLTAVGLGAAAGGIAWYFVSRSSAANAANDSGRETRLRITPRLAFDGVGIQGRW